MTRDEIDTYGDESIAVCFIELCEYQDRAYADRCSRLVRLVRDAESRAVPRNEESSSANLSRANHATAVAVAQLPEKSRGYRHVKERSIKEAHRTAASLLTQFHPDGDAASGMQVVHEV